MADLKLIETGNGGDLVLNGNDLQLINGFQNMPYIGLFGGNVEQSTQGDKQSNELAFDYWANNLLMKNNKTIQYNSEFEKKLSNFVINSSGRIQLQRTINSDLDFLSKFSVLSVVVSLVSNDRIKIALTILEPQNLQSNELVYIWDATDNELTIES